MKQVFRDACDARLNSKRHMVWALLVPTTGSPRLVPIYVSDHPDECSSMLQGSAMDVLVREPGCATYGQLYAAINTATSSNVGYVGLLDGNRDLLCGGDDGVANPAVLFLGADNGYPNAMPLARQLPPNENVGGRVRGPVLVYAARWAVFRDGSEVEQVLSLPPDALSMSPECTAELMGTVRDLVHRRYDDAGL